MPLSYTMVKSYSVDLLDWCPAAMGIREIPLNNRGRMEEERGGVFGILIPIYVYVWLMTHLATGLHR